MVTPGPLQTALLLRSDPLGLFSQLAASGERISSLELPAGRVHLVHEPELVAQIMLDRTGTIRKHLLPGVPETFGGGLFTSSGERHASVRQASQPSFHRPQVERLAEKAGDHIEEALAHLGAGERDLKAFFEEMTLNLVGGALLGLDLSAIAKEIIAHAELMQELFQQIEVSPVSADRFQTTSRRLNEILTEALIEQRATCNEGILLRALKAMDSLDDRQIVEEIRVFLLATIPLSLLLATGCWLLAAHPATQANLRDEPSELRTECFVNETLRLYPPGWLFIRENVSPFEIDGATYPPHSIFLVCAWTLHRSPRYFPEPDQFHPDRWSGKGDFPRGVFLPFSLGGRSCIAERLSRLVAKLTFDSLLRRCRLLPSATPQGEWLPRITYAPRGGIWVNLQTHENS